MKLRPYQIKAMSQVVYILLKHRICYLTGEVRTGKTFVALFSASKVVPKNGLVIFITKKKAIPSIQSDHNDSGLGLNLIVTNYEQMDKIKSFPKPSLVIYDEAHSLGGFPKPSLRAKVAREKFAGIPTLFLSGTPTPESFSQLFHQFWVTGQLGPWFRYQSFYQWARNYVNVRSIYIGQARTINDYSYAKDIVMSDFKPYRVTMTQEDAGFNGTVIEEVHILELPEECRELLRELKKKRMSEGRMLVADTGARLMQLFHQVSSGTYIDGEGTRKVLSKYKIDFIKKKFAGKKIAIFYVYIAEGELLKKEFPNWTDNPEEFNKSTNKPFICQVVSGREGISLSTADEIIFFNISFSAVTYWQARARSQSQLGGDKRVHWLFSDVGIEQKIFKVVKQKQNFTKQHFYVGEYNTI